LTFSTRGHYLDFLLVGRCTRLTTKVCEYIKRKCPYHYEVACCVICHLSYVEANGLCTCTDVCEGLQYFIQITRRKGCL
jgi:hypothetical protein